MLVQRQMDKKKMIILIVLLIVVLVGGWFAWQQYFATPASDVTTIGDLEGIAVQHSRPAPEVDSEIFGDERFIGSTLGEISSFTEQYGVITRSENTPAAPIHMRTHDPLTGNKIILFWELPENSGADGVRIYLSNEKGSLVKLLAEVSPTDTHYEDESVLDGQTYTYLIKTCMKPIKVPEEGESEEEDQNAFCGSSNLVTESENKLVIQGVSSDKIPPAPPVNVTVDNVGDGTSVLITWDNPVTEDVRKTVISRSEIIGEQGKEVVEIVQSETSTMLQWEFPDDTRQAVIYRSDRRSDNIEQEGQELARTTATCYTDMNFTGKQFYYTVMFLQGSDEIKGEYTQVSDRTCYTDTKLTPSTQYFYTVGLVDTSDNESVGIYYQTLGNRNPFLPISF
ncbi:hypothetical protein ACFL0L_03270 [Patescibacteria group bacterium]